jgi:DedD protein
VSDLPANDADELEIKKQARRRLVGAVALALLAIVLLPLAMDGGPPPAAPDMQVSMPSARGSSPSGALGADAGKVDIEPDIVAPGLPEFPPPVPPPFIIPDPSLPAAPPAQTPPPVTQTPSAAQTSSSPAQASPSGASASPSGASASAHDGGEAARALALLNGKTVPPPDKNKRGNKGKVYIQAASFSDVARAKTLAAELKKQGFAAYAEKAGKVHRVRIGPLPRAEAERTAARLKAKGHGALLLSR